MSYRLLLADDDATYWSTVLFSHSARSSKYQIDLALTPEDGLDAATRGAFDIVLLDICFTMGGKCEGLSLLPKIKALRPDLKVVMFSSMDDDRTRDLCQSLGAACFVSKNTVTAEALSRVLDNVLSA